MKPSYAIIAMAVALLSGCGSAEWVHPTKPKDEFALDYNKCEGQALRDPKYQQGNNYMIQLGAEKCLAKAGWVLRDKSD